MLLMIVGLATNRMKLLFCGFYFYLEKNLFIYTFCYIFFINPLKRFFRPTWYINSRMQSFLYPPRPSLCGFCSTLFTLQNQATTQCCATKDFVRVCKQTKMDKTIVHNLVTKHNFVSLFFFLTVSSSRSLTNRFFLVHHLSIFIIFMN